MKKALIICNNPSKYGDLVNYISDESMRVEVCSYKDLAFCIDGKDSIIKVFTTDTDIKEFFKVIVLATSPNHSQNYIFSALSCYCHKYNISMMDNTFSNLDGKLFALWKFWQHDIPVAKTLFGSVDYLVQKFNELGGVGVLKSVQGTKGRDSYLVKSKDEIRKIITENSETTFILQNFIPNDGDWRIILTNFKPQLAIYRSSHGKDFRNNTSVGGEAKVIPIKDIDSKILELSIKAAKVLDIKIAGADIIQDNRTGEYTVLEVNRTPQLVSGAFVEEKQKIIQSLIRS